MFHDRINHGTKKYARQPDSLCERVNEVPVSILVNRAKWPCRLTPQEGGHSDRHKQVENLATQGRFGLLVGQLAIFQFVTES